jgi:DNA/RNA endonuclease G (NUC1)
MSAFRRLAAFVVPVLIVLGCTDVTQVATPAKPAVQLAAATAFPEVRISEFHYDNTGTDTGEAIEISGPAGMDLTGWSVVLYNGNGGSAYNTQTLSGPIPAVCGPRGVIVLNYPANGIQNGNPDGIALVDNTNTVVEFLSYGGSFAGVGGAANGLTSTDIGITEGASTPVGSSLARTGADTWTGPATSSFGTCNDDNTPPPPPPVVTVTVTPATATIPVSAAQGFTATAFDAAAVPIPDVTFTWSTSDPAVATVSASGVTTGVSVGDATITATAPNGVNSSALLHVTAVTPPGLPDVRFSEIHYDNIGTDAGEAIEIEGPAGTDLTGWSIVLYDGTGATAYNTQPLSGVIPASCTTRGVVVVNYPVNGIQNGSPDGFALVDANGSLVEFLSYEGTFTGSGGPANAVLSTDVIAQEASSSPIGSSLLRDPQGAWALGTSSFGACNSSGGPPPPPVNVVTFTGRLPSDPALPVGFEDQLFATERDPSGVTIPTTFTWSSDTPAIVTIDQDGVFRALAAGTAVLRATAFDGTTGTIALPTRVGMASNTALYAGNTEFGDPTDGDPSDDVILRHTEYTTSYNPSRGTPNWVSYDLDPTHFGLEDRCDCFTFDPALPASIARYTTADYTGAGAFHGYGIDRGHLARSFDRTSASLDNAFTFYFSNIVPQAADLNQGPWAIMENFLGDEARFQNKEVYVITGVAGNIGTIKNQGKIVIPEVTWKVAVILPHDQGLADVLSVQDLEVIAVIMPNIPGIRNNDWHTYITTVDQVEAVSGYDLLKLLPDQIEFAVESGSSAPVAAVDGPYGALEGGTVAMSGAASYDPDGDALAYAWDFGDGSTGAGATVAHTYAQDGAFQVTLTVTDTHGLTSSAVTTATVTNVAPVVAAFAGATLLPGETYSAPGSFTDPGADPWTATVNYGDGSGVNPLGLASKTFSLSHAYNAAGMFTVLVSVNDDDAAASRSATVKVLSQAQGVQSAIDLVIQLQGSGKLGPGLGVALRIQLGLARELAERGRNVLAAVEIRAVLRQLDAFVRAGRISAADAAPLRALLNRLVESLT